MAVSGNKNAALPCLASSLLLPRGESKLILKNVPQIRDVAVMLKMLRDLGLYADSTIPGTCQIMNADFPKFEGDKKRIGINAEDAKKLRASVLLIGPLLREFDKVLLPQFGGCKIGPRPIDSHLQVFKELGVDIFRNTDGQILLEKNQAKKPAGRKEIWLKEASVTATENLLLFTAGNMRNEVVILNAACEPHVKTLCELLQKMGIAVMGKGSNVLHIMPNPLAKKQETVVELEGDYIEALTFAAAAALTNSAITIKNVNPRHLNLIDWYLKRMGVYTRFTADPTGGFCWRIENARNKSFLMPDPELKEVKAETWYGLPTDALPVLVVLATQCAASIEFVDYMYNGRLVNLANALNNMGADVKILSNRAVQVNGPTKLTGKTLLGPDIRNGAGLVLAGLCAKGETTIQNFEIVERGYERLCEKLLKLGAQAERTEN